MATRIESGHPNLWGEKIVYFWAYVVLEKAA
jgi:hypothetical protein